MSKFMKLFAGIALSLLVLAGAVGCADEKAPTTTADTDSREVGASGGTENSGKDTSPTESGEASTPEPAETTAPNPEDARLDALLESKHTLSFHEDGSFKILVLSDIHGNSVALKSETRENIRLLVEREKPDLVILDGDNTWQITNEKVLTRCVTDIVSVLEENQIPWAHTYGNHDAEGSNVPKERQQEIYESFEYCVSKAGDEELTGVGNYLLPIYSSDKEKVSFAVWVLDSGSDLSEEEKKELFPVTTTYPGYPGSNYDYIRPDQIAFYRSASMLLQERNGGKAVPGLMAFHIALQESHTAWENRDGLRYTGEKRENVCASAVNSGLFSAILERGDIKAIVNGHDHVNDFMVEYCGVMLCQASTPTAEDIYHDDDMLGGRVFILNEENPSEIETYISYVHERLPEIDPSDAPDIKPGTGYGFEEEAPEFNVRGYNNDTSDSTHYEEISVKVLDGVGYDGSRALAVTRARWNSSNAGNNAEFDWELPAYGKLGENRYLRVWMDLSANQVDFRKATWGLVVNYKKTSPYRTDDFDSPSPFYYLAEGSDEWVELSCGSDGCFGQGDGESVKGLKGWFAFPIEYMRAGDKQLSEDSVVTGFYFYFSLASSEMAGKEVYIDDVTLVKDYTLFS